MSDSHPLTDGQTTISPWIPERDPVRLAALGTFEHNGALFTAADRILGNIVGSGYTHSFRVDPLDGSVVFRRHEETDRRTYIDPDYRAINPGATNAR